MESTIKFSVIVPVYNAEKYMDACVGSVLNQSFGSFELILADDGSSDGSGAICDGYERMDGRVRAFHKANQGQLHTRCFGVEMARGEYCVFLDADDFLEPDALAVLERNISHTGCDCVIYSFKCLRDGAVIDVIKCDGRYSGQVIRDKRLVFNILLNSVCFNAVWRKCVRRACFDGRDYSEYYRVRHGEDLIHSVEIMENAESFLFIEDALYNYTFNTAGVTRTIDYDKREHTCVPQRYVLGMLEKTGVFKKEDYDRLRNYYLDMEVIELRRLARRCSDRKAACAAMERLHSDPLYTEFLSAGYKRAPRLPWQGKVGALNRALYRLTIALFKRRRYSSVILLDTLMCLALGGRE